MIKRYGRNYELRMMAEFNIRTRNLFKDMHLAPKALLKGKIPLGVKPLKSAKAIKKMYEMAKNLKNRTNNPVQDEKSNLFPGLFRSRHQRRI